MTIITLTSKGQLTLPAELRQELGLKAGDKLNVRKDEMGNILMQPRQPLEKLRANLPKPRRKATLEDMENAIGQAIVERYERSRH